MASKKRSFPSLPTPHPLVGGFIAATFFFLATQAPGFSVFFFAIGQIYYMTNILRHPAKGLLWTGGVSLALLSVLVQPYYAVSVGAIALLPTCAICWHAFKKEPSKRYLPMDQLVARMIYALMLVLLGGIFVLNLQNLSIEMELVKLEKTLKIVLKDVILLRPDVAQTLPLVVRYAPAGALSMTALITFTNFLFALSLLSVQGKNPRPVFDMRLLTPQKSWAIVSIITGLISLLFQGDASLAAQYLCLMSFVLHFLGGLSVCHQFSFMNAPLPRIFFYFLLFFLVTLVPLIVVLGLLEPWLNLKRKIQSFNRK